MECLHCGHCCRTMSPLTASEQEPCPLLHVVERSHEAPYYLCGAYERRPEQCQRHSFEDHRFCPVGLDVLYRATDGPHYVEQLHRRIDTGFDLCQRLGRGDLG